MKLSKEDKERIKKSDFIIEFQRKGGFDEMYIDDDGYYPAIYKTPVDNKNKKCITNIINNGHLKIHYVFKFIKFKKRGKEIKLKNINLKEFFKYLNGE